MSALGIAVIVVAVVVAAAAGYLAYQARRTRRIAREAETLVPPPGRFVEIDGNRIHYVEAGDGPPILFVHGLGASQFHFSVPLFDRLKGDFRLIALDRPGSGYSTRPGDGPATPCEQAAFIVRFLDALGIDRPLVVGHSLGGAIALALALDHPARVAGLVLLSPLTRRNTSLPPEFAPLAIPSPSLRRIVANTVAVPNAVRFGERTLAFIFGPQEPPPDYAIAGGAITALRPSHIYATSTDLMAIDGDMRHLPERYGALDLPVALLFGDADRVLDVARHGRGMEGAVAGIDLEIVAGVGHMPQFAVPERVAAMIRRTAARAFAA